MKLENYLEVEKPWGKYEQFTLNEPATVKLITVLPGRRLSYQSHGRRSEYWRCVKGSFLAVVDGQDQVLKEGDHIFIPKGSKHRMAGLDEPGLCLEISFGDFDEEDIVRHEDDYGRAV